MRRAVIALGLLIVLPFACADGLGPASDWVPSDAVDGELRPEIGPAPAMARSASADPLRVVSFNTMKGADVDGLIEALANTPALASAGLILVQEIESHPGEGGSRTSRLAAALGLAYAYVPARTEPDGGTHGLAILSAFPIENVQVMALPYAGAFFRPRIAMSADIRIGARTLHVLNLHLDVGLNVADRIVQLRPAVIDAPDTVLVAGDFNMNDFVWADGKVPLLPIDSVADTDQAPIIDGYMRGLGFATPTAGLGATQHVLGMESRIDAIYTRGLAATPGGVERSVGISDHWPMWIDVSVR